MKIIQLQGENFKKMTAYNITPKGNTVVVSGKNGQGKTSVLDSIVMALAGKSSDVAKLTTKPIKDGAKTAQVTVTTEDYVVTRKWTEKDTYLEMTNRDGMVYKSPQALLDQIVGDLCFDPLEFSRMKPKDQREALLGIVKLDIDLDQWERDRKFKYDQRTAVGGQGKALQWKLDTTPEPAADTPDKPVDVADLVKQLRAAEDHNRKVDEAQLAVTKWTNQLHTIDEERKLAVEQLEKAKQASIAVGGSNPTSHLQDQIMDADRINTAVRSRQERAKVQQDVAKYDAEYEKLSAELVSMQTEKETKLASAKFPIAGLSFADDGVTYKGIPFGQCSSAEQLKVSMAIAMAKNPKLRVIRITDGSLLDAANMQVIEQMADRNDFQIWIEKVDDTGKVGIVIQDGEVVTATE